MAMTFQTGNDSPQQIVQKVGMVAQYGCGGLFAVFWTLFSVLALVMALGMFDKVGATDGWQETPCVVESFEIRDHQQGSPAFTPELRYRYEWQGTAYTGEKLTHEGGGSDEYAALAEQRAKYRATPAATCWVNPSQPQESVLSVPMVSNNTMGAVMVLGLSSVFTLVGIVMLFRIGSGIFRRVREQQAPMTEVGNSQGVGVLQVFFFGLFAVVGLALGFFLTLQPWRQYFQARGWEETPATIVWSQVRASKGSEGTVYRPDVLYAYTFRGEAHQSNTYTFETSSSSGREGKEDIVNQYPAGTAVVCYVNPQHPWQAVLRRDLGVWTAISLFPLPFIAIGLGGLLYTFRQRRRARQLVRATDWGGGASMNDVPGAGGASFDSLRSPSQDFGLRQGASLPPSADGYASDIADRTPRHFTAGEGRRRNLKTSLIFGLIWNGVTSILVYQSLNSFVQGRPEWVLTLFMLPFLAVGLFLLYQMGRNVLALFGPKPEITLTPGELVLGQPFTVSWAFRDSVHKVACLRVFLVGEELARYRRGTSTQTDRQVFFDEMITDQQTALDIQSGAAGFDMPIRTSPSWRAEHNGIYWRLKVQTIIRGVPDGLDEYEIEVKAPTQRSAA